MPWVVAMTKPNHEGIAAVNLQRQGFSCYYPQSKYRPLNAKAVVRPTFPRYIFVKIGQQWRSLSGTRGISYLLMGEGGPQVIADTVIDLLKGREDKNGYFMEEAPPKFLPGSTVKTQEGPLAGLPLIYEGMSTHDRVRVLTELLGRKVPVLIEERLLVAA